LSASGDARGSAQSVGQAFLPAGAGDFPVAWLFSGLESPGNRQTGMLPHEPDTFRFAIASPPPVYYQFARQWSLPSHYGTTA